MCVCVSVSVCLCVCVCIIHARTHTPMAFPVCWSTIKEPVMPCGPVTVGRLASTPAPDRVFCSASHIRVGACGISPVFLLKSMACILKSECQKRPTTVSKENYYSVKRDLPQCQKRPTTVSKETYYSVKRDLLQCQKRQRRPTSVSKET